MATWIRELKMNGLSFAAFEKVHKAAMTRMYLEAEQCYLHHRVSMQSGIQQHFTPVVAPVEFVDFGDWPCRGIAEKSARHQFDTTMKRLEPLIMGHISSLTGEFLRMDYTFRVAKFGKDANGDQAYSCMATTMNEYQEIAGFWLCKTKSLKEIKCEIQKMRRRIESNGKKCRVVWVDNPGSDTAFLREAFGSDVVVLRDIFHVLQDYFEACYDKPTRQQFMADLSSAFFLLNKTDIDRLKAADPEKYGDKEDAFFRNNPRVRTHVEDRKAIKKALKEIYSRYMTTTGMYKKSMAAVHESVLKQLENGWLTDPEGVNMHINIGTEDDPVYATIRSTSQLESFHHYLQKGLHGFMSSPELLHFVLLDTVLRWNLVKAAANKGDKLLATYDIDVLNNTVALYSQLGYDRSTLPTSCRGWKPVTPAWTSAPADDTELFGCGRIQSSSEVLKAHKALLDDGSVDLCTLMAKRAKYRRLCDTWICERMGISDLPSNVSTDEEKDLYRKMLPDFPKQSKKRKHPGNVIATVKNVDFSFMAEIWNQVIGIALATDSAVVQYKTFTWPVDKFTFKDAEHLKAHGAKAVPKAIQAAQSKGDTHEKRQDFNQQSKKLRRTTDLHPDVAPSAQGTTTTTPAPPTPAPTSLTAPPSSAPVPVPVPTARAPTTPARAPAPKAQELATSTQAPSGRRTARVNSRNVAARPNQVRSSSPPPSRAVQRRVLAARQPRLDSTLCVECGQPRRISHRFNSAGFSTCRLAMVNKYTVPPTRCTNADGERETAVGAMQRVWTSMNNEQRNALYQAALDRQRNVL